MTEADRLGAIALDEAREKAKVWTKEHLQMLALKHNMKILQKCGGFEDDERLLWEEALSKCRRLNREPRNKAEEKQARKMRQDFYNNERFRPFGYKMTEDSVKNLKGVIFAYSKVKEVYTSIGEVPAVFHMPWTPESNKIVEAFHLKYPEWTGWDKWDFKRLEVQREERKTSKLEEDLREDSILAHEARILNVKDKLDKAQKRRKVDEAAYLETPEEFRPELEIGLKALMRTIIDLEEELKRRKKELKERKK